MTLWLTDEFVKASLDAREEDVRRFRLVSEARRPAAPDGKQRVWHWRVEPGMEEAFQDLLGWFLPSQRNVEMATAETSARRSLFRSCCRRVRLAACCARAA
jgi:hypothetical protein